MDERAHFLTLPTLLTLTRIAIAPFLVYAIFSLAWLQASILFVGAGITDMADGFIARLTEQETAFGRYLDPIADKILLLSAYSALWYVMGTHGDVPWSFFICFVVRECFILMGAAYLLWRNKSLETLTLRPTLLGKMTTLAHFFLLGMLYGRWALLWHFNPILYVCFLWGTVLCMIGSGAEYFLRWWKVIWSY
jgi:cardiolipin synthase